MKKILFIVILILTNTFIISLKAQQLKTRNKIVSSMLKKIVCCLILFSFGSSLYGQTTTRYKIEYSILNRVPVFPNDDTNDDDISEIRVSFSNSGRVIYNSTATFESDDLTVVDEVITLDQPENEITHRYNSYCPSNNYLPFNTTRTFDGCIERMRIFWGNNCSNFVRNYGRIVQLSDNLILDDPLDNLLYECRPYAFKVSKCDQELTYAVEYSYFDGIRYITGDVSPYSLKSSKFEFNMEEIENLGFEHGQVTLRARYVENPDSNLNDKEKYSNPLQLTITGCSVEYDSHTTTDATCYSSSDDPLDTSNDGSVTVTFDGNVDEANNFAMRYYVFEGNPADFIGSLEEIDYPEATFPQVVTDALFNDELGNNGYLTDDDGDGNYSGTLTGLSGNRLNAGVVEDFNDYFIIYQEIDYTSNPVVVKSGEITPMFRINQPSELTISIEDSNITQPQCLGDQGEVTVTATGGGYNGADANTFQYRYKLAGGSFGAWQGSSTFSFTGLDSGDYNYIFQISSLNNLNCLSEESEVVNITVPDQVALSNASSGETSAPGVSDGFISIDYDGGTFTNNIVPDTAFQITFSNNTPVSGYTFSHNTLSQQIQFQGLGVGSYIITFTDSNSCSVTSDSITVESTPIPQFGIVTVNNEISCSGLSDAQISVPITYGVGEDIAATISYRLVEVLANLSEVTIFNSQIDLDADATTNEIITIPDLGTGNYKIYAISESGDFNQEDQRAEAVFTIDDTEAITFNGTTSIITDVTCVSDSNGSIVLDVSGATNYEYTLELIPAETDWITLPANNTITGLTAQTYNLRLRNTDNTTCQSEIYNPAFTIGAPETIVVTEVSTSHVNVSTFNENDGVIEIAVSGGTEPYTYIWTAELDNGQPYAGGSTQTISNLFAGEYSVKVNDSNDCEIDFGPIIISQPAALNIVSLDKTTDSCFGADSGSITTEVEGTGDLTLTLVNTNTSETTSVTTDERTVVFANLGSGEYSLNLLEVDTSNSITGGALVTIEEIPAITSTIESNPTCAGESTGSISISNVTGGTLNAISNYTYSIDSEVDFNFSNTFTSLAEGPHVIRIREDGGCVYTETVTIAPTPDIVWNQASTIVNNISAAGQMDGSISPVFDGGFDDGIGEKFSFLWTGPNVGGITDQNISGLGAGAYSVQVTDDNGCIINQPFTIAEPGALSVTITNQQNPCFGQTNGSITAAVAGTGPYTLQWSEALLGNLIGETALTLANIGAGTYTLNVIDLGSTPDAVGNSPAVALVEPQAITADTNTTPSCAANGSGTIVVSNVQGGEPGAIQDYTYSIDGTNFQNNPLFENLTVQTYSVWVRDGNGCDGIFSGITVAPSPDILWDEPNTVVTNATAQGASDGTITQAFTSDATNYTYNWNGPATNNETTQNLAGKAAGVYTVIVTNENGCTLERIFTIAEPGILTITVNSTKNPCFGENNGNIQTTVVGTGNLSYQWSEAVLGDLAGETGPNLNNVPEGTYTLTVTDDAVNPPNVVSSNPTTLSDPSVALDAQATPTDAQCAGVSDGMVTITASGGIPPYEYSIDGGANYQPGATFNDLGLGSYSFRVRDSNQCVADATATINEPPIITLSFVATPLSAAGASDGAIDIAASGGTGDLNFSWAGPAGFTSTTDEDISGLTAGDYTVTVSDENGCTFVSNPITIDEPGAIIITLTLNEEILCNGDEFGEILADVQGGVPDYTYQWFQEGNNTPLGETTNLISNLGAGNYFLRVTDANAISRDSNILSITEPTVLQVTLQNKVDIVCSGEASGSINITVEGGTAPYTFQWNNGADSQNLANIEAGDYFVEVFDDNGCFELLEVTINPAPNALQLDATVTNVSEYLANDGSISLGIIGGATPYTINWTRDSDNTSAGNTATITALSADSYTVTVSDANGCNITETYEVTQPDIVEDTIVQPSCQGDSNGSISVLVNQGNGTFTYLWNTGETTNTITNLGAGDYTVTITGFGNGPLTRSYTLVDPLPLEVDLGQDRVLCADQVLELDATVEDDTATYTWTSDTGFSSSNPQVTLTTTGNYTVTVQTASGCTAVGTLSLEVSTDEINAEFAMSSQVFTGDILVAVDISFPLPDTIEWVVPDGATIVKQDSDEAEFIFNQAGEYEIGIITTRGDCIAQKIKKVSVVAKDGSVNEDDGNDANKQVEDFILYPNPTTGRFTADVSLTEPGNISIKVFSFANNALMASERGRGEAAYSIPFDISGMPSGVYAVLLETPYGTSLRKIVVR